MDKSRAKDPKILFLSCSVAFLIFSFALTSLAQQSNDNNIEFTLDINSQTVPLPKIFKPNIDLSGRGFHKDAGWPQTLAAGEVLDIWQKDIGFNGMFRLQYDLWEISQLAKDKDLQDSLLRNYENVIKSINERGGIVILDIFGTPAGLGKVLDKTSPPLNLRAFKELVKNHIKNLSCDKRYNVWYEVWSAPDLDGFFLGREQEYLNLYHQVADAVAELEAEFKVHIPLGGPGLSWWFQDTDGNTIMTPERSLIYQLIKFCYRNRLALDFITWHSYSTDPKTEFEITPYNKISPALIRDWLTYFKFDSSIPLIVGEWNFDRGANVSPARKEKSFITASFIPSRIKNMYGAGLDYQFYFSLEDFQDNREGVIRNTGIFSPDSAHKGGAKSIYNVFRMLVFLGNNMFLASSKPKDEFVGVIATKNKDHISLLIYNYIDPDVGVNYLSRAIGSLNGAERKFLLGLIKYEKLDKVMQGTLEISNLRTSSRLKGLLKKAKELNDLSVKFSEQGRNIKINIKNLKENYLYQRYAVDSSCSFNCEFAPIEEKEVNNTESYQESLTLEPYSVNLVVLQKKPSQVIEQTTTQNAQSPSVPTNED